MPVALYFWPLGVRGSIELTDTNLRNSSSSINSEKKNKRQNKKQPNNTETTAKTTAEADNKHK